MSSASAAVRKPIRVSAWVYLAALAAGAWPVTQSLINLIHTLGEMDSLFSNGIDLGVIDSVDWILQTFLDPVVLIAGVGLAFTGLSRILRAAPGFLYIAGFVLATVLTFAYGSTLGLGSDMIPMTWAWLVGDVPHALAYIASLLLAVTAGFLTLVEGRGTQAGASPAPAAGRQPVAFDTNTGQPIYGYDTNTGAPIY